MVGSNHVFRSATLLVCLARLSLSDGFRRPLLPLSSFVDVSHSHLFMFPSILQKSQQTQKGPHHQERDKTLEQNKKRQSSPSSLGLSGKNLAGQKRSGFYNKLVLVRMYPLLQLLERLSLMDLDLARHDGLALVDLLDDVVDHDAGPVVLELAGLEVGIGALDGVSAVVLAYKGGMSVVPPPIIITPFHQEKGSTNRATQDGG